MKRFIFIILILVFSCNKNNEVDNRIIYTSLSPSIKLNTVINFVRQDFGICSVDCPTPSDSIAIYNLDIDSDSVLDFCFTVNHYNWSLENSSTYCGHCKRFIYIIGVRALSTEDYVSINSQQEEPLIYDSNETISNNTTWSDSEIIYLQGGCSNPNFSFNDSYIGIKHKKKLGWVHISPFGRNGVEILEYAFNDIEYKSIKAGQKQ